MVSHKAFQGRPVRLSGMVVLASFLAGLAFLAGGCAGGKTLAIENEEQFEQVVLKSDKPVLVDFYKGACPTCVIIDDDMDKLSEEYQGRAVIAKVMIMTAAFQVKFPNVKDAYDISYYPTVVLFVNGQPKDRWALHYDIDDYRQALDQYVTPAPAENVR